MSKARSVFGRYAALIICIAITLSLSFCTSSEGDAQQTFNDSQLVEAAKLLQPGDLVFRKGNSYASEQIRNLSLTEKSYSHVGIAVSAGKEIRICSIEPVDNSSPTDKIRYEEFEKFVSPGNNAGFAIYRFKLSDAEQAGLLRFIDKYYQKQVRFDPVFIYETDDSMYCSELISKALDSSTQGRVRIERSLITEPSAINSIVRHFKKYNLTAEQVRNRPVVLMDNIFLHPLCQLVKKYEFEK